MSISFVEFQKLLNPVVPEKFKLIYEILYYYKINIDELLSLTADRIVEDNINTELGHGIVLTDGKFINLTDDLFSRIKNFLEYNGKAWGNPEAKFYGNKSLKLNYVFESNKKGNQYTIPTLYKKFKEHCLKVGILRDLALGSLINTDLGRIISIINSKLDKIQENVRIILFCFDSEELSILIRYFILHLNYEEIIDYKKEKADLYSIEYYHYPHIELTLYSLSQNSDLNPINFLANIEESDGIIVYGIPSERNLMLDLINQTLQKSNSKISSFIIDSADPDIVESSQEIISKESMKNIKGKAVVQFIMLQSPELKSKGINLLSSVEEFFISFIDKLDQFQDIQVEEEP